MFLKNCWYAAALERELGRTLLARTVCNQPIVLFRAENGQPVALEDRCCHRSLPLSLGKLVGDRLQCGYHGLEYDADGRCVRIPGQSTIPPGAQVKSYPAIERHKFIWLWLGDPARAEAAAIPDMHWNDDPSWTGSTDLLHVKCGYRLVSDNLMDLTHEAFLHTATIGNEAVIENPIRTRRGEGTVQATRWMIGVEPPPLWKNAYGFKGKVDRWQIINFIPPGNVVLDVGMCDAGTGAPEGDRTHGAQARVLNAITPETERSCWYFWGFPRSFKRDDAALTERLHQGVVKTFNEDIAVLEAQQVSIERNPAAPIIDVNADAGMVQSWRLTAERLEAERPGAGASAIPFRRDL